MKYFKIQLGYDQNNVIPITEDELPKAIAAHMSGGKAAFMNGSVSGKHISAITPDWNRALGFNAGYKLEPEDWNLIRPLENSYRKLLCEVKENVRQALKSGKMEMLEPIKQISSSDIRHNKGLTHISKNL